MIKPLYKKPNMEVLFSNYQYLMNLAFQLTRTDPAQSELKYAEAKQVIEKMKKFKKRKNAVLSAI